MSERIAVFGAGSWGTALTVSLAQSGHDVALWARREEAAEHLRRTRHNASYLPDITIPDSVTISSDLEAVAPEHPVWIIATPAQAVRAMATQLRPYASADHLVVSLAKGIENETLLTTSAVLRDVLPDVPAEQIGVLYGPSHAEEVGEGKPTTVVASATTEAIAERIQNIFITQRLRVYINTDLLGVEIAGSVKNVLAIAAGISDGLGFGDNTKAALVTRGMAEIRRLGLVLGARPETFAGLAGFGDVIVTCFSRHSRNRYFGEQIGRGRTLEEVEAEMTMVAEGVSTTLSVHDLSQRHGIELPITEGVYRVLFEGYSPHVGVEELMTREPKCENWLPEVLRD